MVIYKTYSSYFGKDDRKLAPSIIKWDNNARMLLQIFVQQVSAFFTQWGFRNIEEASNRIKELVEHHNQLTQFLTLYKVSTLTELGNKITGLEKEISNKQNDINTILAKWKVKDLTELSANIQTITDERDKNAEEITRLKKELAKPKPIMVDKETQTELTAEQITQMERKLTKTQSKLLGSLFANKLAKKKAWGLENRLSVLTLKIGNLAKEKQGTLNISSELKERVAELENLVNKGEADLHVAEVEIKKIEELFKQKEAELIQFQEIKETKWAEITTKIKDLEKLVEERDALLKGVELELNNAKIELEKHQEQIPLLEQEKRDLEAKLTTVKGELGALKLDKETNKEEIKKKQELIKVIEDDLTNTKKELANSQNQTKIYQDQTAQLEEDLIKEKAKGDENKNIINQLNIELTKLRNADKDRSSLLSTAQSQVSNLIVEKNNLQTSVDNFNTSISSLQNSLKSKDDIYNKLKKEKDQVQSNFTSTQQKLTNLQNQGDLSQPDRDLLNQCLNYLSQMSSQPNNFNAWSSYYNWFTRSSISNSGAKIEIQNTAEWLRLAGNTFKGIIDDRNNKISEINNLTQRITNLGQEATKKNNEISSLSSKLNYWRSVPVLAFNIDIPEISSSIALENTCVDPNSRKIIIVVGQFNRTFHGVHDVGNFGSSIVINNISPSWGNHFENRTLVFTNQSNRHRSESILGVDFRTKKQLPYPSEISYTVGSWGAFDLCEGAYRKYWYSIGGMCGIQY